MDVRIAWICSFAGWLMTTKQTSHKVFPKYLMLYLLHHIRFSYTETELSANYNLDIS